MYKKLIIIISLFLLVGCVSADINTFTLNEIIDSEIASKPSKANINSKGYRYYLPSEFIVKNDYDYIQELTSKNEIYYLNIDVVSYYYKNAIIKDDSTSYYEYYDFENDSKTGYLKITKNNDNFFVELCYNYAILEVQTSEDNLKYVVSRGMQILNSIEYNEQYIVKYVSSNDIESSETMYKLPEPKKKNENKNVLEYIEIYEEDSN